MYIGNNEINKAYLGSEEVTKIYQGNTVVYEKETDYSKMPLTFEILSDGNVVWKAHTGSNTKTIQYSKNGGEWTSITSTSAGVSIPVVSGDTVQFRGDNTQYGDRLNSSNINTFCGTTVQYNVYGNIMSLINSTNFVGIDLPSGVPANFTELFGGTQVVNAENLMLPSNNINQITYLFMFRDCTSLIKAPKVIGSSSTVFTYNSTYNYALKGMFINCRSLTTAPELPAPTVKQFCYEGMFENCSSLNYIKCLATGTVTWQLVNNWVIGVAATGTFVTPSTTTWGSGNSGIPSGWTRVNSE